MGEVRTSPASRGYKQRSARSGRVRAVSRWLDVFLDVFPERLFQLNQLLDLLLISVDAEDLQVLTTDQHSNISGLLSRNSQLVHDLQMDT